MSGSDEPRAREPATLTRRVKTIDAKEGATAAVYFPHSAPALREWHAVGTIHRLNAEFVQALSRFDCAWFVTHLPQEFVCTLPNGERIRKDEFIRRTHDRESPRIVGCDEVDVHPLGAVALVHGAMHTVEGGSAVITRFTAVWQLRQGNWQPLAAQLTPLIRRDNGARGGCALRVERLCRRLGLF